MGINAGFDMVPRLGRGDEDSRKWKEFIETIQRIYDGDPRLKLDEHHLEFALGEHLLLPFDGHKFLRFASKVSDKTTASETEVKSCIGLVASVAKMAFGSRVRSWGAGYPASHGFYNWLDVHDTIQSNSQVLSSSSRIVGREPERDYPSRGKDGRVFEIVDVPGKGKGLVANHNIATGTRILCEAPLFTVPGGPPRAMNEDVASKLRLLSKEKQRQFLSMHNSFPGPFALVGIFLTNAIPCGPDAATAGVYLESCLINHACVPNCHRASNEKTHRETTHAIRDILAGEEITITYVEDHVFSRRRFELLLHWGFDCHCELCTLPAPDRQRSDRRRERIQLLQSKVDNPFVVIFDPLFCLRVCDELASVLIEEYRSDSFDVPRVYYDAFQVAIAHGDQARARTFAEMAYKARVTCEGEDSPETQRMKELMRNPAAHPSFGGCSMKWRTSKTSQPKGLSTADFEKWLWRR
ncbi:hypothetical protein F4780DRAFT_603510 [Xylariomycetidae sp. FL0641]|nr:hypothetical protein F4780DRAFT_603510 [Xylariomycetidae sp. FL0641]